MKKRWGVSQHFISNQERDKTLLKVPLTRRRKGESQQNFWNICSVRVLRVNELHGTLISNVYVFRYDLVYVKKCV